MYDHDLMQTQGLSSVVTQTYQRHGGEVENCQLQWQKYKNNKWKLIV